MGADGVTSVFEPVQLLVGDDWLLSCWLPPRVFRGLGDPVDATDDSSSGLYLAVAQRWATSGGDSAEDLAEPGPPAARRRATATGRRSTDAEASRPVRFAGAARVALP